MLFGRPVRSDFAKRGRHKTFFRPTILVAQAASAYSRRWVRSLFLQVPSERDGKLPGSVRPSGLTFAVFTLLRTGDTPTSCRQRAARIPHDLYRSGRKAKNDDTGQAAERRHGRSLCGSQRTRSNQSVQRRKSFNQTRFSLTRTAALSIRVARRDGRSRKGVSGRDVTRPGLAYAHACGITHPAETEPRWWGMHARSVLPL